MFLWLEKRFLRKELRKLTRYKFQLAQCKLISSKNKCITCSEYIYYIRVGTEVTTPNGEDIISYANKVLDIELYINDNRHLYYAATCLRCGSILKGLLQLDKPDPLHIKGKWSYHCSVDSWLEANSNFECKKLSHHPKELTTYKS